MMLSMPDEPPSWQKEERRSGKRIGGVAKRDEAKPVEAKPMEVTPMEEESSPVPAALLPIAGVLLVLLMLKGLLFPDPASFSYSVVSYSSTTVRTDDGSGSPKYETKTQSSFNTNIPGLAERLAEQGKKPEEAMIGAGGPLFPF